MHGPQEPYRRPDQAGTDMGFLTCNVATAPYSGSERKKRKMGDRRAVELENILKRTFETVILLNLYQRSEIRIAVNVFESDGSLPCAIINATTLALMDAGVAMRDMVVSCSVGIHKQNLYRDVNQLESTISSAYIPLAVESTTEEVLYLQLDNRLSVEMLQDAMESAIEGCRKVKQILVGIIRGHMRDNGQHAALSQHATGKTAGDDDDDDMDT